MGDLGFLGGKLAVLLAMHVEPGDNLLRLWKGDSTTEGWMVTPQPALSQMSCGMEVGRVPSLYVKERS